MKARPIQALKSSPMLLRIGRKLEIAQSAKRCSKYEKLPMSQFPSCLIFGHVTITLRHKKTSRLTFGEKYILLLVPESKRNISNQSYAPKAHWTLSY